MKEGARMLWMVAWLGLSMAPSSTPTCVLSVASASARVRPLFVHSVGTASKPRAGALQPAALAMREGRGSAHHGLSGSRGELPERSSALPEVRESAAEARERWSLKHSSQRPRRDISGAAGRGGVQRDVGARPSVRDEGRVPRRAEWQASTARRQGSAGSAGGRQGSQGRRQGSAGGRPSWRGSRGGGGSKHADPGRGGRRRGVGGLEHAQTGQAVEVRYDSDWRPAVIVGLTRYKEVVVQYVGAPAHCRETIDIRSDRMRPLSVSGSKTVFRVTSAEGEPMTSVVAEQLEWCAQVAAEAASRGRQTASVPLVASQSALGWRERRRDEAWFGSWFQPRTAEEEEREREEGGGALRMAQLPRNLAGFRSLVNLLDALESAMLSGSFGAKQSVVAMNHIKRLSRQAGNDNPALKVRMKETMRCFAEAVSEGMERLSAKEVALVLNAVTSVLDAKAECPGLRTQPGAIPPPELTAQEQMREKCVFWGMFDTASRRLLRLGTLYTSHVSAGVSDFDNPGKFTSQGVAMIVNAFSHAGIRDEPLLQMLARVVTDQLDPQEYTAQSVSVIASSFQRLSFMDTAVFECLAEAAVVIPARTFDGQALSVLLLSLSRAGYLSSGSRLMSKAADMVPQIAVKKWKLQQVAHAVQALSFAARSDLRNRRVATSELGSSTSDSAALDTLATVMWDYAASHVTGGALLPDASTSPATLASLAAESLRANERGWLTEPSRDAIVRIMSGAAAVVGQNCVHAFSHSDVSTLFATLLRARVCDHGQVVTGGLSIGGLPVSEHESDSMASSGACVGAVGQKSEQEVWKSLVGVVAALPVQRASVSDIVSLLGSLARAGEAGILERGLNAGHKRVVCNFLQYVSGGFGGSPLVLTPAQLAGVVGAAARCGVRDVVAMERLAATASSLFAAELAEPLLTRDSLVTEASTIATSSAHGGGAYPFPLLMLPGPLQAEVAAAVPEQQKEVAAAAAAGWGTRSADSADVMEVQKPSTGDQQMAVDEIGALVRGVAYLNVIYLPLLAAATSVLLHRASLPPSQGSGVREGVMAWGNNAEEADVGACPVLASGADRKVAQAVANIAWAAAVMGGAGSQVHTYIATSVRAPLLQRMSREQLVSIHQYLVEYQLTPAARSPGTVSVELERSRESVEAAPVQVPETLSGLNLSPETLAVLLDQELALRCREAIDASVAQMRTSGRRGKTQDQVLAEMRDMGLEPIEEFVDPATGYSIDALVELGHNERRARIAVEVDGPSHFVRLSGSDTSPVGGSGGAIGLTPVGATVMKHRHLERVGYTVLSVPYWEWDTLNHKDGQKETGARRRYLREKLRACCDDQTS